MEEWRDVDGYEGIYQISNHGRLKSFKKYKSGMVLSVRNSKGWYLSVVICRHFDKKEARRSTRIHRLVAEAFIPRPKSKDILEVNHIDGNKQNNRVDNLEWVTKSQNIRHSIALHPWQLEGMHRYNKLLRPDGILQFTLEGEYVACFANSADAARATGVCHRNINQVARKTEYSPGRFRKQAGGFKWEVMPILDIEEDLSHAHSANR